MHPPDDSKQQTHTLTTATAPVSHSLLDPYPPARHPSSALPFESIIPPPNPRHQWTKKSIQLPTPISDFRRVYVTCDSVHDDLNPKVHENKYCTSLVPVPVQCSAVSIRHIIVIIHFSFCFALFVHLLLAVLLFPALPSRHIVNSILMVQLRSDGRRHAYGSDEKLRTFMSICLQTIVPCWRMSPVRLSKVPFEYFSEAKN